MNNWEEIKLGKYMSLKGGYAFSSNNFTEFGIPIIRISNISNKGIRPSFAYISKVNKSLFSEFELSSNDILIAMSGATTGKNCKIKKDSLPALLNQRVGKFRIINKNNLDNEFLYYVINTEYFQNELFKDAIGGAQPNISGKQIENITVQIPKKPNQQKIAKILNTIDAVIEKTEHAITKYQAIKKGMMHDLFTRGIDVKTGQLRPSLDDAPALFKESALGMIPRDWTLGKLIDSASTEHYGFTGGPFGSDLQTKDYTDTGVQVIQLQNIGDGEFINKSIVYTSNKKADELRSCNIFPNDIIIAKMAYPVARACIIPNHAKRFVMASDGIRLKVDTSNYNTLFVKESINNKYFRRQAVAKSTGTTRERIGLTELKNIKVKYPKFDEQNAIAERIESIDCLIREEFKNLKKHQKIKKGLMQDLLTGKVEVKV